MNEAVPTHLLSCPACGVKPVRAVDMRGYCATIEMFSH